MLTVKSLRAGVTICGHDSKGVYVEHEFKKKGATKSFKKVDAEHLKQGVALGFIHFSGKPENLPQQKAVENEQHNIIELTDAVSSALDASIEARESLAEAKMRHAGLPQPLDDDADNVKQEKLNAINTSSENIEKLELASKEAGEAYNVAKADLEAAK